MPSCNFDRAQYERQNRLEREAADKSWAERKAARIASLDLVIRNCGLLCSSEEEFEETRDMDDKQFKKHLDRMTRNYTRSGVEE